MLSKFKLKLTSRLLIFVLGSVFIMNLILLISIGLSSSKRAKEAGIKLAVTQAKNAGTQVELLLKQPIDAVNFLSKSINGMIEKGNPDREVLIPLQHRLVSDYKDIYSVWIQIESGEFDNDGKYKKDSRFAPEIGRAHV